MDIKTPERARKMEYCYFGGRVHGFAGHLPVANVISEEVVSLTTQAY